MTHPSIHSVDALRTGDSQPPEGLRKIIREAIEKACPTDEQCLADEAECFKAHPIHEFASRDGRLEAVYADVDGMVGIVLAALFEACEVREERRIVIDDENVAGLWLSMPLADSFTSLAAEYASGRVERRLVIETQPVPVLSDNSTEEQA